MSKGKALLKDTITYGIGNFGSRLLGFLLLPFYTSVFSKEDYGYIDLITMGSILFITVVSLKLTDGAYRFLWEAKNDEGRTEIISSVLNAILISFLMAWLLCIVVFKIVHFEFLYSGLIFVWLLIRMAGEYFQQAARALGKNHIYSISGIILAVSLLFSNLLLLGVYKLGVLGFILSLLISYTLSLIYSIVAGSFLKFYRPNIFSRGILKSLLIYSLPLLPTAVSWWLIRVSGRYFLSHAHGLEPVGIYAVADKLPTMIYMVNMTFYMAWQDAVIKHFNDVGRDEFFSKTMEMYVRVGLSIVILLTLFLKPFFYLMVNGTYHEAHVYVPVLLLAVFVLCLAGLYDAFFMATKRTTGIFVSAVIAAILTVVFNLLFVKQYGIWATTISTLISAVILLSVRIYQLRKQVRIFFNYREIILMLVLWIAASAVYDMVIWQYLVSACFISLGVFWVNLKELKVVLNFVRGRLLKFA